MATLNILLGAGFSVPSGFPTGKQLNEKFSQGVENKLLKMSSGEWFFDEHSAAYSSNGKLNTDYISISYLLTEFIKKFKSEVNNEFDYEEFFDWFNSNYNNQPLLEELSEKANGRIKEDHNFEDKSAHYIKSPNINQYNMLYECFNYLIGDVLHRSYKIEAEKNQYKSIIDTFNDYDSVNIFTLNHDLLMEYLLREYSVENSNGFSTENSFIVGDDNNKIEIFEKESYTENVKLFKLHGSIDYYQFEELVNNKGISQRTGNYWYFKPKTYHDKHFARRINPETGDTIQDYNWKIIPQFLTGKNKKDLLVDKNHYEFVYKAFKESFENCNTLLVIGYSFGDSHINEVIKESAESYDFEIININPSKTFPYRQDKLTEYEYISDF